MYFDKHMRMNDDLIGRISKGRKRDDSVTIEFFQASAKNKLVRTVLPDKQFSGEEYELWRQHIRQQILLTEEIINKKGYDPFFKSLGMTASKHEEIVNKKTL